MDAYNLIEKTCIANYHDTNRIPFFLITNLFYNATLDDMTIPFPKKYIPLLEQKLRQSPPHMKNDFIIIYNHLNQTTVEDHIDLNLQSLHLLLSIPPSK